MNTQTAIADYMDANRRSPPLAFLLALLLGPLGAIYGSPVGGSVLLIAAILGALTSGPVIPLLIWLISLIYAPAAASAHNERTLATARLLASGRPEVAP